MVMFPPYAQTRTRSSERRTHLVWVDGHLKAGDLLLQQLLQLLSPVLKDSSLDIA